MKMAAKIKILTAADNSSTKWPSSSTSKADTQWRKSESLLHRVCTYVYTWVLTVISVTITCVLSYRVCWFTHQSGWWLLQQTHPSQTNVNGSATTIVQFLWSPRQSNSPWSASTIAFQQMTFLLKHDFVFSVTNSSTCTWEMITVCTR